MYNFIVHNESSQSCVYWISVSSITALHECVEHSKLTVSDHRSVVSFNLRDLDYCPVSSVFVEIQSYARKDRNENILLICIRSFIGKLLRGYINKRPADLDSNDNEFRSPETRNDTVIAMNQFLKLFSESNLFPSSSDVNGGSNIFRLGFLPDVKTNQLRAFLFIVNMNVTFNTFSVQHAYYKKLEEYFRKCLEQLKLSESPNGHLYEQVKHG